jgi:hypothetical protein
VTDPAVPPPRPPEWWARPGVVLPLIGTVVVIVALLTPQPALGRLGDPRLSSHLAGSLGARALAELAERFGWRVTARDGRPSPGAATGTTIHAVLAPPVEIMPADAHAYLEAVRAGDGLLLALDRRNALADSLGVRHSAEGGTLRVGEVDSAGCHPRRDLTPPLWIDGQAHLYGVRWMRGEPAGLVTFATLSARVGERHDGTENGAVGFPLGRGRVVVVADPDLLRNDVLRRCEWGADATALRMLEWLRAGGSAPRSLLAFDEYHQGFGPQPSVARVVGRFLTSHPAGRALLHLALAGLVLLCAVGPRPLAPHDPERIERRDPLEQIDALAHAYEQVGASRTATARLLRGVRVRVEGAVPAARQRPDEAFLDAAAANAPTLGGDVAVVRRALREPLTARDFPSVGAALRRIEDTLTTTRA